MPRSIRDGNATEHCEGDSNLHGPSAPVDAAGGLELFGVNHRTLNIAGRECLCRHREERSEFLRNIRSRPGVREAALLCTCNRFEVIAAVEKRDALEFLPAVLGIDPACAYHYRERGAAGHLFRVAAGLDSLVLGETQILGQIKDAYREAVAAGTVGPCLHGLFQQAFHAAKKVRSRTSIGAYPISISHVAVELAEHVLGPLQGRETLIIGSGTMAELALMQLKRRGCRTLLIANRTRVHAEALARRVGGEVVEFVDAAAAVSRVDLAIGSVCCRRPLFEAAAVGRRRREPVVLIDLGMPRNFPAELRHADSVYLYDLDDLKQVADQNRHLRRDAAAEAAALIDYAEEQFARRRSKQKQLPLVLELRLAIRRICDTDVRRTLAHRFAPAETETLLRRLAHRVSERVTAQLTASLLAPGAAALAPHALLPLCIEELRRDLGDE